MTERSVTHATFVIERTYKAARERVFAAFATKEAKGRWFGGDLDKPDPNHRLDFRVGGEEYSSGGFEEGGAIYTYRAIFHEIVPGERIVHSYTMDRDDTRMSLSLATVELRPRDGGTHLIYTEMGAFLDGHDKVEFREEGTKQLFDNLGVVLTREGANA